MDITADFPVEARQVIDRLERQDAEERAQGLPPQQRLQALDKHSAHFLYWLVLQRAPRLVVEVGASQGYSGIWLGLAAREVGGRVVTFERRGERAAAARRNYAEAGLAGVIELREGSAIDLLPQIADPIDFLFIDAEKAEYPAYLRAALPLLAPGAVVVADNILSHAAEVGPFLEYLESLPQLKSMVLNVDRGMALAFHRP